MKFGTIVHVTLPSIEGKVLGAYLGCKNGEVKCRLEENAGLRKEGSIGWFNESSMTPAPLYPPTARCHREECTFRKNAPGSKLQTCCTLKLNPTTCGVDT